MNENLKILIDYLESVKKVDLNEKDIEIFNRILQAENNDGYKHAVEICLKSSGGLKKDEKSYK